MEHYSYFPATMYTKICSEAHILWHEEMRCTARSCHWLHNLRVFLDSKARFKSFAHFILMMCFAQIDSCLHVKEHALVEISGLLQDIATGMQIVSKQLEGAKTPEGPNDVFRETMSKFRAFAQPRCEALEQDYKRFQQYVRMPRWMAACLRMQMCAPEHRPVLSKAQTSPIPSDLLAVGVQTWITFGQNQQQPLKAHSLPFNASGNRANHEDPRQTLLTLGYIFRVHVSVPRRIYPKANCQNDTLCPGAHVTSVPRHTHHVCSRAHTLVYSLIAPGVVLTSNSQPFGVINGIHPEQYPQERHWKVKKRGCRSAVPASVTTRPWSVRAIALPRGHV